jgi:glutamyl-tRNA synthetase
MVNCFAAVCCVQSVTKGPDGQVTGLAGQLHLEGDFKKTRLKLTWLADVPELVPLTLTDFDYLITKKKVGCYF